MDQLRQNEPRIGGPESFLPLAGFDFYSEGVRCSTCRFHAKLACRAQTRSHYVIRLSDAVTQFEIAIRDIAYCSGSEG